MCLEEALRTEHNKARIREITDWVGADPQRFAELYTLFLGDDRLLSQRAAWAVGDCVEAHPELIRPHMGTLLRNLERPHPHPAIARNTFRLLQFAPVSGEWEGRVLSAAMAALGGTAPIAVKVYAMTILRKLADLYPDILGEARLLIDEQWAEAGPAFRSRARKEFGRKWTREQNRPSCFGES
jgi:hypothetical protein